MTEAEAKAPAVIVAKAKAEAVKIVAADKRVVRQRLYSNDNFLVRRNVVFALLAGHAAVIIYLLRWAPDDVLHQQMVLPVFASMSSIALGYLGFATVDDKDKRAKLAASDATDSAPPPEE